MFQHTAARRRLEILFLLDFPLRKFQHTAARRRLVEHSGKFKTTFSVSTHSRPKAAGNFSFKRQRNTVVSTHSRPKAAGSAMMVFRTVNSMFQHTAARRRLALNKKINDRVAKFQHTAARRRLALHFFQLAGSVDVSTHSRPKAAGSEAHIIKDVEWVVSTHSRPKAAGLYF